MRTYEDVKSALSRYRQELEEEAKNKSHFVVVGGNMCITKKGASTQYVLGKGDPIPMIKSTAKANMEKQQAKVMGDIKLEVIPYFDWLKASIEECEKLCACMDQSIKGEPVKKEPSIQPTPVNNAPTDEGIGRPITMNCPECPLGINTCVACRFCVGVNTTIYPWKVICRYK